ncbi:type 1 glutamine amidotransferase [Paenibacillus kobensis]|uniref:type 1 glutamine amidotransferase n=1 Tax=Paenibacillus kobensis TaxID=59841 RepID=UPI001FE88B41|nr:gamma-glutamyl-gamma-aminobutyrate hydrolase family protein [Paenibacillus kobensis]
MLKIRAFRHFAFDDTKAFEQWADLNRHWLCVTDPSDGVDTAWLAETDVLIVLGGPMSAYDDEKYSWLADEKAFIQLALQQGIKVLGICLGAQMLAELLGGKVYRHSVKEIGWHRIERTGETHPWMTSMPEEFYSFQWHGDTFDLPPGAQWLARSGACGHQAFAWGDHVMGLQFHWETTPACIEQMLERWAVELIDSPYIQSAEQIRAEYARSSDSFRLLYALLDRLAAS